MYRGSLKLHLTHPCAASLLHLERPKRCRAADLRAGYSRRTSGKSMPGLLAHCHVFAPRTFPALGLSACTIEKHGVSIARIIPKSNW
jgi:hypothetical protein